jgi:hypothetical protein
VVVARGREARVADDRDEGGESERGADLAEGGLDADAGRKPGLREAGGGEG